MFNERFRHTQQNYDIEISFKKHFDAGTITDNDIELIKRYIAYREAVSPDLTKRAVNNLQITLITARRFIKTPYAEMTADSLRAGIALLKRGASEDGKPYKTNTIRGKVKFIKSFARWLSDEGIISIKEKDLKDIKPPKPDYFSKTSDKLLSVDEINKLINACKTNRDRAIVGMMYECGARIQEIAFLTWGDITGDKYSLEIRIDDYKTHREKIAYMTEKGYMQLVTIHKNTCQFTNPGDFVFCDNIGQGMPYDTIKILIKRAAQRAGINKKITPHVFRTSRITNMGAAGYTDLAIREQMWGNQGTTMYNYYMKPNKKQIKKEILSKAGIVDADPAPPIDLKSIPCPKCGFVNGPGVDYCGKCTTALTETAVKEKAHWDRKADDYVMNKLREMEAEIQRLKGVTKN